MINSTSSRKSRYCCGSASVSCLISFLESLRCVGAGPEDAACAVLSVAFADGDAGTTASPDGPWTVRLFAFESPTCGNCSASFSRPSVSTFGGAASASTATPSPCDLTFWTMRATLQASLHVGCVAFCGQNEFAPGPDEVTG